MVLVVFLLGLLPVAAVADPSGTVTLPFSREGVWIVIEADLDGHGRRPFLLDTGAQNTMTPEVAKALGLRTSGRYPVRGFGRGTVVTGAVVADSVDLGGTVLRRQTFFVGPLPNTLLDRGKRPRLAGLLGPDLFRHFVVRIEYAQQRLVLTPFSDFRYSGTGYDLPLSVPMALPHMGGMPLVTASLDGITGSFGIDTGSGATVFVYPEFAEDHGLPTKYAKYIRINGAGGIGGHSSSDLALARSFALGSTTMPQPPIALPVGVSPQKSAQISAGMIGGGVLARFVPTFDFQRLRLYLEPTPYAQQPRPFDRDRPRSREGRARVFHRPHRHPRDRGRRGGDQARRSDPRHQRHRCRGSRHRRFRADEWRRARENNAR